MGDRFATVLWTSAEYGAPEAGACNLEHRDMAAQAPDLIPEEKLQMYRPWLDTLTWPWTAARSLQIPVVAVLFVCIWLSPASAWLGSRSQAFPDGKATVVVHAFCSDDGVFDNNGQQEPRCDILSQERWQIRILDAVEQWNNAGANFQFSTRPYPMIGPTGDDDACSPKPKAIFTSSWRTSRPRTPALPAQGLIRRPVTVHGVPMGRGRIGGGF